MLSPRDQPLTAREPSGQSFQRRNGELRVLRVRRQRPSVYGPTTLRELNATGELEVTRTEMLGALPYPEWT